MSLLKWIPVVVAGFLAGYYIFNYLEGPTEEDKTTEIKEPEAVLTPSYNEAKATETELIKLNNQFVVPIFEDGKVSALVILSITVETELGLRADVFKYEPKLRSAMLTALFDFSNSGGFSGVFTEKRNIDILQASLLHSIKPIISGELKAVIVTDILRQDAIIQ